MATQTVLSAPPEEIEKEEVKKMEADKICPPPKEGVESTKSKESESLCPSAEAKIEEEKVSVIQNDDLDNTRADEEPKGVAVEDKPVELPPPAEIKVDDKPVELPPTLDEKKTEDAPIVDKDTPEVVVPGPDTTCVVAEPTIEKEDIKSEPESTNEEKPEQSEKVVDVPESSPVDGAVLPEGESTPQEASVGAPVLEDKIPEKIEKEGVVDEPLVKVEGVSPADEVELPEKVETCAIDAPAIQVEEKHVDSNPIVEANEATERATGLSGVEPGVPDEKNVVAEANEVTERATGLSGVEPGVPDEKNVVAEANEVTERATGLSGVEPGKNEEKSVVAEELMAPCEEEKASEEAKDTVEVTGLSVVEPGKNEEKSVVAEELMVPCEEEKTTEDAKDGVEVTGGVSGVEPEKNATTMAEEKGVVAEELLAKVDQDEATSRDIEQVCDKGNKKEEETTVVEGEDETTKNIDEKIDEKILETPQANEEEDTKTYQDVPAVKKQSFVKIMKQSLVKAKKAIIGKSQNTKAPASEPKDDANK